MCAREKLIVSKIQQQPDNSCGGLFVEENAPTKNVVGVQWVQHAGEYWSPESQSLTISQLRSCEVQRNWGIPES
jgi:hypothetical protein